MPRSVSGNATRQAAQYAIDEYAEIEIGTISYAINQIVANERFPTLEHCLCVLDHVIRKLASEFSGRDFHKWSPPSGYQRAGDFRELARVELKEKWEKSPKNKK